jgi:hypothetical protein
MLILYQSIEALKPGKKLRREHRADRVGAGDFRLQVGVALGRS